MSEVILSPSGGSAPSGSTPKVSVAMVTYNHEKFIAQAIESVLMQKTRFPYELVIGEDCSPDRTRAIVSEFRDRNPQIIRPLLHERNLGFMENFVATLRACRGQYVALLDGDDYWTSPVKLQKQADFLDGHPGFAICYHDVLKFEEDGTREPQTISPRAKRIATLEDLLVVTPPSCSVMYRQGLFAEFPEWFRTLEIGDWPLHVMNARRGRIGYLDEVMAAHRKHGGGVYSSLAKRRKLKAKLQVYECLDEYLGPSYRSVVRRMTARCYHRLALEYESAGESAEARACARKALLLGTFNRGVDARRLGGTWLRLQLPRVYRLIRGVARRRGFPARQELPGEKGESRE